MEPGCVSAAQRSDAHQRRPYWVSRYFGGRSEMPGPRDRGHSAFLQFSFFEFCFYYAAQGRDIDEDASWNAIVELLGFDLCQ